MTSYLDSLFPAYYIYYIVPDEEKAYIVTCNIIFISQQDCGIFPCLTNFFLIVMLPPINPPSTEHKIEE